MIFEAEDDFEGISKQQSHQHHLPHEGEDEGHRDEELDHHKPTWNIKVVSFFFSRDGCDSLFFTWQELFPDEPVLVPIEGVAAGEEEVELVVGVAELVEAELPEAHVLEGRLGVLPADQPIGRCEAHQEQQAGHEGANGTVEKGICRKRKKKKHG